MESAAPTPERIYRWQRHIYDATRALFLVGRDRMLRGLEAPPGGSVLEIGCGTARNLIFLGRRHADWNLFGLDASPSMLRTAHRNIPAELRPRVHLALGDATDWDARSLFGRERRFDAIFFSYSLSMIVPPERAMEAAVRHLAPGGAIHLVDFADASLRRAPWSWGLGRWLEWWHVRPAREWAGGFEEASPPITEARSLVAAGDRPRPTVEQVVLGRGYARLWCARFPAQPGD